MNRQRNIPYLIVLVIAVVGVTAVYGQMFLIESQLRATQTGIFTRTESAVGRVRQDILRANAGQLQQYDGIAGDVNQLARIGAQYERIAIDHGEDHTVAEEARGVAQAISQFNQQVEDVVSDNIRLQNALRYLTGMVHALEMHGQPAEYVNSLTPDTRLLLQLLARESLHYARWPSESTAGHINSLAGELRSEIAASEAPVKAMLGSIVANAGVVLEYSDLISDQIEAIFESDLAYRVQGLRGLYAERAGALHERQDTYRLVFYLLLITLIGSTLFYMIRLKVIASELGTMNRKLEREIEENLKIGRKLGQSEERLSKMFSESHDGILVVDVAQDRVLDCNASAQRLFEKIHDEICAVPASSLFRDDFDQIRQFASETTRATSGSAGNSQVFESASLKTVEFSLSIFDAAHNDYVLVNVRDIGDRVRAEQLVQVQRKILEMIATRTDLTTILDTICNEVAGVVPSSVCTVMLLDKDAGMLDLAAGPRIPEKAREALTGFPAGPQAASCGTAAWCGEPVIVPDIETDPRWASYRDFASEFGLEACWSIPILDDGGQVLGTFAISRFLKGKPDYFESEWLGTASHLAGIAIQRQRVEEQIQYQAYHDFLTDLPNRTLLLDRLRHALTRHYRHSQIGAVLFIDLDHFKNINDSLGHPVGDQLLQEVAARLRAHVRAEDTVARLGGDEFVVLLSELGTLRDEAAAEARVVADKLRASISELFEVGGHRLHVTPSIGIVLFPTDADDVDEVMRHADTSMYRAKSQGRDNIQFFMPAMASAASSRLTIETELRHVLERNELCLSYQPQVDLASGNVIGAEALLRWEHPRRGMVSPGEFIPVLEATGLILPVGEWVLREACNQINAWDAELGEGCIRHLAVNVSPRQFRQPDFVEQVEGILKETGVDARRLELELTEGIVIQEIDDTITKMRALKGLGLRFSIDDFGTGYSSLAYLKRLPVDVLKIDRSFVQDLPNDRNDAAIVETIIAMAKHFDVDIIAEGVETAAQLEFLREQNCLAYQGYFFSRPVNASEFLTFFARKVG